MVMLVRPLMLRMLDDVEVFGPLRTLNPWKFGSLNPVPWPFTLKERVNVSPTATTCFADATNSMLSWAKLFTTLRQNKVNMTIILRNRLWSLSHLVIRSLNLKLASCILDHQSLSTPTTCTFAFSFFTFCIVFFSSFFRASSIRSASSLLIFFWSWFWFLF